MESIADHPYAPKTVPETITLADGTVLSGSASLNIQANDLWMRIWQDISVSRLSALLEDPEKTAVIKAVYSEINSSVFEGYTELNYIMRDPRSGETRARLKKPT